MLFKIILLLQIILNTFYIIIHDIAILTFTYNFDINKKETVGIVKEFYSSFHASFINSTLSQFPVIVTFLYAMLNTFERIISK